MGKISSKMKDEGGKSYKCEVAPDIRLLTVYLGRQQVCVK